MTFTNKAIKCDTWDQMEHLARIAEDQGYRPFGFREHYFTHHKMIYFRLVGSMFSKEYTGACYSNVSISSVFEPITTYTTFINSHPDISVEGC